MFVVNMFCITSGTQAFIFALTSASDSIVLHSFGTRFHNLGPRKEGASMPYFVVRIFLALKCEVVRREYGFSINSKTSFMSSSDKPFLTLKISVTSFWRFLWWMIKELSSISNSWNEMKWRIIVFVNYFFEILHSSFLSQQQEHIEWRMNGRALLLFSKNDWKVCSVYAIA